MSIFSFSRTVSVCLCFLATTPAIAGEGLQALQRFMSDTQRFQANFTQTQLGKAGQVLSKSSGQIAFSRPNRFRWQVEKPFPQLMIADGQRVWIYDPDLQQVIQRKLDQSIGQTPAALLAGSHQLDQAFMLQEGEVTQDGLTWALASPRTTEGGFSLVKLGFKLGRLQAMEMVDFLGQRIHVDFQQVEINPVISAERFKFSPPRGVDVITQ